MNVLERITKLQSIMKDENIDAYIVPSADYHQSEYVGEHFKARQFITGFTGSYGIAVITKNEAALWTDGRYLIRAKIELKDSNVKLFEMGTSSILTVEEYLESLIPDGGTLAFDGRVISINEGKNFNEKLSKKNIKIQYSLDLIDRIWENRPSLSKESAFLLDEKYSGESTNSKLKRLREFMREKGTNKHIIASLDDSCWLLNLRGKDVEFSPLALCYVIVTMDCVQLYIDNDKISDDINEKFKEDNIQIKPYNDIYEDVKKFSKDDVILLDPERINYALYNNIPGESLKVEADNPCVLWKAIKNDIEIENIKNAHIKDGIACTKFMYWLKNNIGKIEITEISASDKLEEFRKEQDGFLWPSFEPICAYKEHAAMMHYSSTKETNCSLHKEHLFLADTGGNYYEGSTDITRTFVLGPISDELKTHFTAVVRAMINLSKAKFLYGCKGYNLDVLARGPIWDLNLDYKCGTGHGVGYLLNIHEAPSGFRWYIVPSKHETHTLEAGMIITDEPGIYIENSHGIRIENEFVIRKGEENVFGKFMYMETITFAPIDLDGINKDEMNKDEKEFLNNYHKMVYNTIAPHLTGDEQNWLKIYTREI